MAGGVALNCVANGKLIRSGIIDRLFVQPAAGDAGGALGAALFVHYQLLDNVRKADPGDSMQGSLLGPKFTNDQIRTELDQIGASYEFIEDEAKLLEVVASDVANEKVIGWFAGRMEFGPRALGARSFIGDARSPAMQAQMNLRIKFRESFRPFAPVVLREDVNHWFEHHGDSPYMLVVADVKPEHLRQLSAEEQQSMKDPDLRKRVNVPRSTLPAITHVDNSARLQTIDERRHGRFYRLMREFKRQTGCGVMINTSFNIRGEPIVCTPSDAFKCLQATDMDVLVVENFVLRKSAQKQLSEAEKAKYVASFKLD
jgi:carbamoyltransferase